MRLSLSVIAGLVLVSGFAAAACADEQSTSNALARITSSATNAPINLKLRDFPARKLDLTGKLVKIQFARRDEIKQISDGLYETCVSDGDWSSSRLGVVFGKDGFAWVKRAPDFRGYYNGNERLNGIYAIVLGDTERAGLGINGQHQVSNSGFYYGQYGGDLLLLGPKIKNETYGKPTYGW